MQLVGFAFCYEVLTTDYRLPSYQLVPTVSRKVELGSRST